jgi:hypothetical protein
MAYKKVGSFNKYGEIKKDPLIKYKRINKGMYDINTVSKILAKQILNENFLSEENLIIKIKSFFSLIYEYHKIPSNINYKNKEFIFKYLSKQFESKFFYQKLTNILSKNDLDILIKELDEYTKDITIKDLDNLLK